LNLIEVILAQGSSLQPTGRSWACLHDVPTCHRLKAHDGNRSSFHPTPRALRWAALLALLAGAALAQSRSPSPSPAAPATGRRGRLRRRAAGRSPLQASVIGAGQLRRRRHHRPGRPDPAGRRLSDAYNATATGASLSVRGFTLDNRFNYRRDGLPINAETALPLANKERSKCSRAPAACRPAPARPAAWSTWSSSAPRPCATGCIGWTLANAAALRRRPRQRFGADGRFGCA
jgi:iron complex outermembrane receptor protein